MKHNKCETQRKKFKYIKIYIYCLYMFIYVYICFLFIYVLMLTIILFTKSKKLIVFFLTKIANFQVGLFFFWSVFADDRLLFRSLDFSYSPSFDITIAVSKGKMKVRNSLKIRNSIKK